MTVRLEEALRQLTPQDIERLTQFAETLARMELAKAGEGHLNLEWAGAASGAYPEYQSGVDAAHGALAMMRQALEKGLP